MYVLLKKNFLVVHIAKIMLGKTTLIKELLWWQWWSCSVLILGQFCTCLLFVLDCI